MNTLTKTTPASVRTTPSDGSGFLTAIAYTYKNNVDGIVLTPEALDAAITTWQARGRNLALRWQHDTTSPDDSIGVVTEMERVPEGLFIAARLDLGNPLAVRVYDGLLAGRINEFSIAWAGDPADSYQKDGVTYVTKAELLEVSVVMNGAARETRLISVKAKSGVYRHPYESAADAELAKIRDRRLRDEVDAAWREVEAVDAAARKAEIKALRKLERTEERRKVQPTGISLADLRARMLLEYGDDDDVRTAVGLPTRAEEAAAARKIKRGPRVEAPHGRTVVLIDSRMRPVYVNTAPDNAWPIVR